MKKYLLIFALIALVSLIVMPVTGYTLDQTWGPITTLSTNDYYYNYLYATDIRNASGQTNGYNPVTKVTYRGKCDKLNLTLPDSGTCGPYDQIWNGQATIANVSFAWDNDYVWGYFNSTCDYEWTINWNQAEITEHITYPQSFGFDQSGYCEGWDNDENLWRHTATTSTSGIPSITLMTVQHNNPVRILNGTTSIYSGSSIVTPESSFACTPTVQSPGANVVCTDSSTNIPTEWLWMEGINGLDESTWDTATTQNYTFTENYPALYSVKLKVTNSAGSSWYNRTDYINFIVNATPNTCDLEPAEGYSRTKFRCMNPSNDASVFGCNMQLKDIEGNAWSNQTDLDNAIWCIDTLPLHHINAYADATGYTSGSRLNVEEWDNMQYTIPLIPGYMPNASAGKVWVYVSVSDFSTSAPLPDVLVSISGSGLSTQSATTGSSGAVALQWPNSTTAYINAAKSGYTTGSKVITTSATGPDTTSISIHRGTLTATLTPSTTSATPIITIGPYGTPGASGTYGPGYVNNQGQIMMDFLATNGLSLVELCVMVTILALLGVKLGK